MTYTREFYWNVGHGVILPMFMFVALTAAILVYGIIRRIRIYRKGKPLPRLDHLPTRIARLVERGLGQLRVMIVKAPGIVHAFQFWGMLLLLLGTIIVMIQVDFTQPLFNLYFIKGTFYLIFKMTLNIAGLVVAVMLGVFLVRRFIYKPKGLATIRDDYIIYGLLFAILITAFFLEGARMEVTEINQDPYLAMFSPVGLVVAHLLTG